MARKLMELRDLVRVYIDESSPAYWANEEIDRLVNLAKDEIVSSLMASNEDMFIKSSTVTTANGTREYSLASDFGFMRYVEDADEVPIYPAKLDDKPTLSNISLTDEIRYYIYETAGTWKIGLIPEPTGATTYTYWYTTRVADSVEEDDTFAALELFEELMAVGAARRAKLKGEQDVSDLEKHEARLWKVATTLMEGRSRQEPRRVHIRGRDKWYGTR